MRNVPTLCLFIAVLSCATTATPAPRSAADATDSTCRDSVARAVRAYLRTFHLNERELVAGLAIPWSCHAAFFEERVGVASATGKLGSAGHQLYEITAATFNRGTTPPGEWLDDTVEIAP